MEFSEKNNFRSRLCYSLVDNIMKEVEHELLEAKAVRFLYNHPWLPGKRLRPLIFLLSNLSIRVATSQSITTHKRESRLASAIELLHEASLIHDDIVDRSDLRRGAPTMQMLHGDGLSLLIGDYMIFQGLKLILDTAESREDILLARELANTGLSIAHGEAEQLDRYLRQSTFDDHMNMENYIDIIAKKTAMFFAGCAEAGVALAGASVVVRKEYREFGLNLGIVFQIMDDMMDILGDEKTAKKTLKNNLLEGTVTLPMIHAYHQFSNDPVILKLANREKLDSVSEKYLYTLLSSKTVINACQETVSEFIDKTTIHLSKMPMNIYSMGLSDLFDYVKQCPWSGNHML